MSSHPDILIVGAGPSGLVAALSLLQNGVPVRLIDREPSYRIGQRGAGIMPRSLELFNLLGVLPDIELGAMFTPLVQMYELPGGTKPIKTFEMSPYTCPTPGEPYLNIMLMGQSNLEEVLRSHLAKYGCYIELATELKTLEQTPDHVTVSLLKNEDGIEVEETADFKWVVGTDGARGVVRKLLGLSFLGESRTVENFVIGDIRVLGGLDREHWHMWGDPSSTFVSLRPTEVRWDNQFNFMIAGVDIDNLTLSASPEEVIRALRAGTDREDIKFGEIVWLSQFRPNIRMVDQFGKGRVFIAGDSGHVHSPTGGQGMNSSIQDSFNLAWKLALVTKELSPPSLLDSYTEERLPVIADMLDQTTALLNKTFNFRTSGDEKFLRGKDFFQLGIHYRWSSIVVDEQDDIPEEEKTLAAGDRAPNAPGLFDVTGDPTSGDTTSLFELFGSTYHTALIFANHAEECFPVLDVLAQCPDDMVRSVVVLPQNRTTVVPGAGLVVQDQEGHGYTEYGLDEEDAAAGKVVIVRPDGVIGAFVNGAEGVRRYFRGIFAGSLKK